MAITIIYTYPDGTSLEKIKEDIDNVLRGFGSRTSMPSVSIDYDGDMEKINNMVSHVRKQGYTGIVGGGR